MINLFEPAAGDLAELFEVLANDNRLQILYAIHLAGEISPSDISPAEVRSRQTRAVRTTRLDPSIAVKAVAVAAVAAAADWLVKVLATVALDDGPIEVGSLLTLRLSHNPGVAFGVGDWLRARR